MAFNLAHFYPITFHTKLQEVTAYLKGEGAYVYRPCRQLELEPVLWMIYSERLSWTQPSHGVMMEVAIQNPDYRCKETDYESHLVEELDGVRVNPPNDVLAADSDHDLWERYERLTWLTDFTRSANELKDIALAYRNKTIADLIYCSPFLIVRINPVVDRV